MKNPNSNFPPKNWDKETKEKVSPAVAYKTVIIYTRFTVDEFNFFLNTHKGPTHYQWSKIYQYIY